jgi:hypothetical protein
MKNYKSFISIFLLFFLCLLAIPFTEKKANQNISKYGYVFASIIKCREFPTLNSKVIKRHPFGFPLKLTKKTNNKVGIGGKESFWYFSDTDKCWLFGGFLKISDNEEPFIGIIDSKIVMCNFVGGGFDLGHSFRGVIIGEHYYTAGHFEDSCLNEDDNCEAYSFGYGSVEYKNDTITFTRLGRFYFDKKLRFSGIKKRKFNPKTFSIIKRSDQTGKYYSYDDEKYTRYEATKICSQIKDKLDDKLPSIRSEYFQIIKKEIRGMKSLYPLVKLTKKDYGFEFSFDKIK